MLAVYTNLAIAIQAGGQSRRMGEDKGLVLVKGRPMVNYVIDIVSQLSDNVFITTNEHKAYEQFGLPLVGDKEPGAGALPGLLTALTFCERERLLVVACDMPLLNLDVLRLLLDSAPDADLVLPEWGGYAQPLQAVYRRESCVAAVTAAVARGEKRMISFHKDLEQVVVVSEEAVAALDPEGYTFFNANTPEDLLFVDQQLTKE